jgi:hypothetical protein
MSLFDLDDPDFEAGHPVRTRPGDRELRAALRRRAPPAADPRRVHHRAAVVGPGDPRQAEGRRRHDVPVVAQAVPEPRLQAQGAVPELDVLRRRRSPATAATSRSGTRSSRPPTSTTGPSRWCARCDRIVEAVWTWKTGVPPTGSVRYGKQYDYRCPSCRREVVPPMTPSLHALDLTQPRHPHRRPIKKPLAARAATMARAERCRQRFAEFPAVLMPAKAVHGTERHPWQPMATQTSQQETAILSTGALIGAAGNTYERPGSDCRRAGPRRAAVGADRRPTAPA